MLLPHPTGFGTGVPGGRSSTGPRQGVVKAATRALSPLAQPHWLRQEFKEFQEVVTPRPTLQCSGELQGDHVGAYMLSKRPDEGMGTSHLGALNIKQEFQEPAGGSSRSSRSSSSSRSSRSSRSSSPLGYTYQEAPSEQEAGVDTPSAQHRSPRQQGRGGKRLRQKLR